MTRPYHKRVLQRANNKHGVFLVRNWTEEPPSHDHNMDIIHRRQHAVSACYIPVRGSEKRQHIMKIFSYVTEIAFFVGFSHSN